MIGWDSLELVISGSRHFTSSKPIASHGWVIVGLELFNSSQRRQTPSNQCFATNFLEKFIAKNEKCTENKQVKIFLGNWSKFFIG